MDPSARTSSVHQSAIDFLYNRINYERSSDQPYNNQTYRLSRMERLLGELGNPHRSGAIVHIAGSKGKGSCAWLMAETLKRSGYRTGLYTSPHLSRLEERFVIDGQMITADELASAIEAVRPAAERLNDLGLGQATFFELTTAIAWWVFRERKVDISVVEVGLGGRLDSTNVCLPNLCMITSISFDHQQQLGNSLAAIAGEKAGIIKPGIPVVSGVVEEEPAEVIRNIARQRGALLRELGLDFASHTAEPSLPKEEAEVAWRAESSWMQYFDYRVSRERWPNAEPIEKVGLRMLGEHQLRNAAVVLAGIEILREHGWQISAQSVREAFGETQVIGRTQRWSHRPTIILDTAHNDASIAALVETLESIEAGREGEGAGFQQTEPKKWVIFAASRDKNYVDMGRKLDRYFDRIILTQFESNPRAVSVSALRESFRVDPSHPERIVLAKSPAQAFQCVVERAGADDLIVICGSFFLAAELLPVLERFCREKSSQNSVSSISGVLKE